MECYFGYVLIDNYYYFLFLLIKDNLIYLNNSQVLYRDKCIENNDFVLIGEIKEKEWKGIAYGKYAMNKFSEGYFTTYKITKRIFNFINSFKSPYNFLLDNIYSKNSFDNKIKLLFPLYYVPRYFLNILDAHFIKTQNKINTNIKVMTFNVCSNFVYTGKQGIKNVLNIIKEYDPDIVILQEIGKNNLYKLYENLKLYFISTDNCILSKFKIVKEYDREHFSPIYGIRVNIKGNELNIFNTHLENKGFNNLNESKKYQLPNFEYGLITSVNLNLKYPSILAGDFNTLSHLDTNKPFIISKKLEKYGWIDTYRKVNPIVNMDIDYTWPNCQTNLYIIKNEVDSQCYNKFRIDYIYSYGDNLIPIKSNIINQIEKYKFPSDHNALLTEFKIL